MIKITDKKILVKYVNAFLLGDGWLSRRNNNESCNACYGLRQIAQHKDYIDWQANILENLTSVHYYNRDAFIDPRGVNNQAQICITSKAHPFYTTMYERVYTSQRIKSISYHDLKLLDWETLAILYQDDGYIQVIPGIKVDKKVDVYICTENYTYGDLTLLQSAIFEKVGIPFTFKKRKLKDNYGYRLVIRGEKALRFLDGISKYVKPSYEYKIDASNFTGKYRTIDSIVNMDDEIV